MSLIKSKLKYVYNALLCYFYGKFIGVSASAVSDSEELIFPTENFSMPEMKDIFGKKHKYFHSYETIIHPFYVRSFKNAYCLTNREEVFSSDKEVISEYTSQKINPFIGKNKRVLCSKKIQKIDGSVAQLSLSGLEDNYYHFLTECLGRLYLIEKSKFKPDFYIISNHLRFQSEWLALLGIHQDRIISTNVDNIIQAKTLIVPDFINNWEFVKFRGYKHYQKQWIPHWIANLYKEKIVPKIKITDRKKIFISRSDSKHRKIENENEVVELFADAGFDIYNPEKLSVIGQIGLFANASIIAGIHGAGFANTALSDRSTKIFEIFPEYYHDSGIRIQAKATGLKYYYMVGRTRNIENIDPQKEDVFIDLNLLKKALDIILVK